MINVTSDELLTMLGMKEAELIKLRVQNQQLQAAYTDIKAQLETKDAVPTAVD